MSQGGQIPEENRFREVVSGETLDSRPRVQEILRKVESPDIKAVLVKEAEAKCTQMLTEANAAAAENAKNADALIAAENARVEDAKKAAKQAAREEGEYE